MHVDDYLRVVGTFVEPADRRFAELLERHVRSVFTQEMMVRYYTAPAGDGSPFVQTTDGPQLNLLAAVCTPGVAQVHSGYLRASDISDPSAFASALQDRFGSIRVGVHDELEVVLGFDWHGEVPGEPHRTIAQVFTSTVAEEGTGGLIMR
ncbi:MAG TPA: hypothetical protein PKI03_31065, partial [Pseudomonadota bacterium]|nr:hypothetical protein [Pseudomonadota bacterium]